MSWLGRVVAVDVENNTDRCHEQHCGAVAQRGRDYPITYDTILEALAKINEALKP